MPRNVLIASTLSAAMLAVLAEPGVLAQVPAVGATSEVRDAANRLVATAEFREGRGEVLITIRFPSPPVLSGTHAIHIHEVGRCDPPDFLTAGNIFNPFGKKHGRQNPEGPELGDLPNVNFTTGLTAYNTSAPGATLAAGPASLLNPTRSLVIFSGEDDQKTDPEGNSGSRLACGVISPVAGAPPAPGPGGPVAAASPTATRPAAPAAQAAPRIASPVPAQPAAAQPAAKPANSPVVVRPPAVVNAAASPSPVAAAQGATPILAPTPAAAAPLTSANSGNGLTTLLIAVLGVGLVGAGYLLRRRGQLQ